jgi:hypothetical protein
MSFPQPIYTQVDVEEAQTRVQEAAEQLRIEAKDCCKAGHSQVAIDALEHAALEFARCHNALKRLRGAFRKQTARRGLTPTRLFRE